MRRRDESRGPRRDASAGISWAGRTGANKAVAKRIIAPVNSGTNTPIMTAKSIQQKPLINAKAGHEPRQSRGRIWRHRCRSYSAGWQGREYLVHGAGRAGPGECLKMAANACYGGCRSVLQRAMPCELGRRMYLVPGRLPAGCKRCRLPLTVLIISVCFVEISSLCLYNFSSSSSPTQHRHPPIPTMQECIIRHQASWPPSFHGSRADTR